MFVVVLLAAAASFAVVMRVLMTEEDVDSEDPFLGLEQLHMGKYEFILSYFVEFILALFIYYPLFQFVLFTGMLDCLGCGQVRFGSLGRGRSSMGILGSPWASNFENTGILACHSTRCSFCLSFPLVVPAS